MAWHESKRIELNRRCLVDENRGGYQEPYLLSILRDEVFFNLMSPLFFLFIARSFIVFHCNCSYFHLCYLEQLHSLETSNGFQPAEFLSRFLLLSIVLLLISSISNLKELKDCVFTKNYHYAQLNFKLRQENYSDKVY